ncbi:MAG: SRPBCC family protein [Nocardioidaceae bacterium]|nr:SRPBCC family protein [Nocardioidaceae bacterium]
MPSPKPISATVRIAAPPDRVWAVVGDVARMPEWSPELRRLTVLGRRVRVGTTLLGLNRRGWVAWPTSSKVTRLEPERARWPGAPGRAARRGPTSCSARPTARR